MRVEGRRETREYERINENENGRGENRGRKDISYHQKPLGIEHLCSQTSRIGTKWPFGVKTAIFHA